MKSTKNLKSTMLKLKRRSSRNPQYRHGSSPPLLHWILAIAILLQTGQLWIHGSLIHAQRQSIESLRSEIQNLIESLDALSQEGSGESLPAPDSYELLQNRERKEYDPLNQPQKNGGSNSTLHGLSTWSQGHKLLPRRPKMMRTHFLQENQETQPEDQATKDIRDSRKSAQDAVAKARKTHQQMNIEHAIKQAEQKKATERAFSGFLLWSTVALGVLILAFVVRGILKRRNEEGQ